MNAPINSTDSSQTPEAKVHNETKISTERVGRTGWDLLAEFRGRPVPNRPPIEWSKVALYLFFFLGCLYLAYEVRQGIYKFRLEIEEVSRRVESIQINSASTARAAKNIQDQFEGVPLVASNYVLQDADIPTCKARAFNVLLRQNAKNLDTSQVQAVTAQIPSTSAGTMSIVIVCTPHNLAYVIVTGHNGSDAERTRNTIVGELTQIATAEAAKFSSPPVETKNSPIRKP